MRIEGGLTRKQGPVKMSVAEATTMFTQSIKGKDCIHYLKSNWSQTKKEFLGRSVDRRLPLLHPPR